MRMLIAVGTTIWTSLAAAGEIIVVQLPVAAPTLDQFGLIALAVMVGVAGAMIVRRKK